MLANVTPVSLSENKAPQGKMLGEDGHGIRQSDENSQPPFHTVGSLENDGETSESTETYPHHHNSNSQSSSVAGGAEVERWLHTVDMSDEQIHSIVRVLDQHQCKTLGTLDSQSEEEMRQILEDESISRFTANHFMSEWKRRNNPNQGGGDSLVQMLASSEVKGKELEIGLEKSTKRILSLELSLIHYALKAGMPVRRSQDSKVSKKPYTLWLSPDSSKLILKTKKLGFPSKAVYSTALFKGTELQDSGTQLTLYFNQGLKDKTERSFTIKEPELPNDTTLEQLIMFLNSLRPDQSSVLLAQTPTASAVQGPLDGLAANPPPQV